MVVTVHPGRRGVPGPPLPGELRRPVRSGVAVHKISTTCHSIAARTQPAEALQASTHLRCQHLVLTAPAASYLAVCRTRCRFRECLEAAREGSGVVRTGAAHGVPAKVKHEFFVR